MKLILVAAAIASLLTVVSASASSIRMPVLILSKISGSAGTRVTLVGRNCAKPYAQPDTLAWHDHYDELHDIEHKPPMGLWRRIPVQRTSPTAVRALFVVLRSDHRGSGLLDLFCNGQGSATARFTVTR
jgi:hypothetical protein